MKTLIISLVLVLIASTGFSQLVQENVIDGDFKLLQLDNGITKCLKYHEKENTLYILNLDHSIWKTVEIPLPEGHFFGDIKLISTNVFNKDYLVEILYTSIIYDYFYNYENPAHDEDFVSTTLNIINEEGEVLLKEEKINDYAIVESIENNKLFVYRNVSDGFNRKSQTVVYTLEKPDKLITQIQNQ
jgi:hypothetical protein